MGRSETCTVTVGTRHFKAQVELETDEIIVRGPEGFRLKFAEIQESVQVVGKNLQAADKKRAATFELGAKEAALWMEKIRNPPSRLDKLGIKASTRLAIIGTLPRDLEEEIRATKATIVQGGTVTLVILMAEERRDLSQLDTLREWIFPDGGIWVIREKGSDAVVERDIHAASKAAKLVPIKNARISERYTADKLVVPRKDR